MRLKLQAVTFLGIFAVLVTSIFAQNNTVLVSPSHPVNIDTIDETTDYYKIIFPIGELGNCANFAECLKYCNDPVNNNSCTEFAKKNGFYTQDPIHQVTDEFWTITAAELGCNSYQTCRTVCEDPANFDKCDAFAKKQKLSGGYVDTPDKPEYLKIASEILGCNTAASCATFCDDPVNSQKCTEFANKVGLLGGQTVEGPGGCTSEATCKSYCSDPANFSECSKFVPPNTGSFTGPGGCNSPESCRSYCEQNSETCRSYAPGSNGVYVPVTCGAGQYFGPGGVCTPQEKTQEAVQCAQSGKFWNGTSCADQPPPGVHLTGSAYFQPRPEMGNCKTPGECYDYCKANSGKCAGFDSNTPRPGDNYIPSLYYTPGTEVKFEPRAEMGNCDSPGACYDYCRANPGKCAGFNTQAPRPSDHYVPGTYYTPPSDYVYFTPPAYYNYVTPVYYTPPEGSNYTTPQYHTPGSYPTPNYYTPPEGSNYTTPSYYSPYYYTPGTYYTPGGNYPTPSYYTPGGSYPTPTYATPGSYSYPSPSYYTPGSYPTPSYYTPGYSYPTPSYGTPSSYPTPSYGTPSSYPTPSYGTPDEYHTPSYSYPTPVQGVATKRSWWQVVLDFVFRR